MVRRFILATLGVLVFCSFAAANAEEAATGNLIRNADGQQLNDQGEMEHWSVRARQGEIVFEATEAEGDDGETRRVIQVTASGADGYSFKLQPGALPKMKPVAEPRTYRFSAKVKVQVPEKAKFSVLFRLGDGEHKAFPKIAVQEGWQEVTADITVPANAPFGRYDMSGGGNGEAVILLDQIRLERLEDSPS